MEKSIDLAKTLIVSFGHLPVLPPPRCFQLRIQALEGRLAADLEKELFQEPLKGLGCRRLPNAGGASFQIRGDYRSIQELLSGEARGAGGSDAALRQALADRGRRALENWERRHFTLALPRGRRWTLGERAAILGILNVTPDSFSDGGRYLGAEAALARGLQMIEEGAEAIDLGGESTRPGAQPVPLEEEARRVVPVLARLRQRTELPISVDTTKAEMARMALDEGADMINDVSALEADAGMAPLLADRQVPVVLMHRKGRPQNMQEDPHYDDATGEIFRYLEGRLQVLERAGIDPERTIVDPGIGFGKRSVDNRVLVRDLGEFRSLGRPVLIGLSRKSFLGRILGKSVEEREAGTLVAHTLAALSGVAVIRAHNVPNAREMVKLLGAFVERQGEPQ
ncbi:MAG: dihydropteroate synthase [Planctomycetes bacterium]|nr:dihydropteroate synthase [Planctomycetota bacterium]